MTKRFVIAKEKARCSEKKNENKMKPQVCRREATLRRGKESIDQKMPRGFVTTKNYGLEQQTSIFELIIGLFSNAYKYMFCRHF